MGDPVTFSGFVTKVNGVWDWELAVENRGGLRTVNVRLATRGGTTRSANGYGCPGSSSTWTRTSSSWPRSSASPARNRPTR